MHTTNHKNNSSIKKRRVHITSATIHSVMTTNTTVNIIARTAAQVYSAAEHRYYRHYHLPHSFKTNSLQIKQIEQLAQDAGDMTNPQILAIYGIHVCNIYTGWTKKTGPLLEAYNSCNKKTCIS